MTWHLFVHWLDDLRHEGISTFAWESVKSNIGAWPWQATLAAIIAAVVYAPLRARVVHEVEQLHMKLDHIIEHHPDIPKIAAGRTKYERRS